MNFFEHQAQARRQTRWLLLMFILAVFAVVVAVDLLLLLAVGYADSTATRWEPFSSQSLHSNAPLLAFGTIASVLLITLASLFKTMRLRSGGGVVARELGATLVESDPRDLLRQRLRNVVEEIALASGTPVPEIYIMEQEAGINAFAAGYTPADAAITVTRGALEKLTREELQGVIAHEFSHILNGDMRINIRLMGALFGILLLALAGRRIIMHTHFGRSREKGAMAIFLMAFGLMVVGYLGQFFGRWIKAAISRQREYLADSSAVQFTRNPGGISGALKKIAIVSGGSHLAADTEEVSHMLFGDGRSMPLFSTHPPLLDRIRRIEPGFQAADLESLAARMARGELRPDQRQEVTEGTGGASVATAGGATGPAALEPGGLISQIGQPGWDRVMLAAALVASIPGGVRQAAQSIEWAPAVLFYCLIDVVTETREQQLLLIARHMGTDSEGQVRALLTTGDVPSAAQRLPLLELAFPALKRRPAEFVTRVLATVQELVQVDSRVDVFEYLLARLITQHLWESQNPHRVRLSGSSPLTSCLPQVSRVLAILATHGHDGPVEAELAYQAGMARLVAGDVAGMPVTGDWVRSLDEDLPKLDQVRSRDKEHLVGALLSTSLHDGRFRPVELELLRVICGLVHIPLPLLGRSA
jgi:Zn-dependent protease with chaperone function